MCTTYILVGLSRLQVKLNVNVKNYGIYGNFLILPYKERFQTVIISDNTVTTAYQAEDSMGVTFKLLC